MYETWFIVKHYLHVTNNASLKTFEVMGFYNVKLQMISFTKRPQLRLYASISTKGTLMKMFKNM